MSPYGEIINRWKAFHPVECHGLGIHDYDGKVPDMSLEAIGKRIAEIKEDLSSLRTMDEPTEKLARYEYNLLISTLEIELYELDEQKDYLDSPIPYVFSWYNPLSIIESSYTMRSFDSIDNRVKAITELENNIPAYVEQAMQNLEGKSIARPKLNSSIDFLNGYISYYNDELISFVTKANDGSLLEDWSQANERTVTALTKLRDFLQKSLETAHDNFALGEDAFLAMLTKTEGLDPSFMTTDLLLEVGEKDLENNLRMLQEIADRKTQGEVHKLLEQVENDYPAPEELLEYTAITLDRTRQFVIDNDLVTVPSDEQCQTIYTPKSMRSFAFAAMDTPGPFEVPEASEAYYWVTPPDPSWSAEKTKEFMKLFNKSAFESITIHEAWPGHYLQLLFGNQTESDVAKMFAYSYAMIEGWAHYTEEMIYESGYAPFDRDHLHVGQLLEALIRNVRYVVAIRMHCRGMSIDEATTMFREKAYMSQTNAEIEARRGTIDPMYLNYTLGKLMIKKLKSDYMEEKGDDFDLKTFHDELLSYGSPTISVLRKMMLENPDKPLL